MSTYCDEMLVQLQARWDAMSYENREAATAIVFQGIVEAINMGGCSYRYLIYDILGFDLQSYTPLYLSGGMEITNYIHDNLQEEA